MSDPTQPIPPSTPPPPAAAPVQVQPLSVIPAPEADRPLQATARAMGRIREQIQRVFVGQASVVDQVLAGLLSGGHLLLEGKPGLGKTHLVLALANTFGGSFGRIQFTPDLMPSDVTGHSLYDMSRQEFQIRRGPVFANLLLADEINRAPAKTQAALLEVMQESQVTIDGQSIVLEPPFMVVATQNPIEQEGTYPLPEAQLDRFLMKILIDYPNQADEEWIVGAAAGGALGRGIDPASVEKICSQDDIVAVQHSVATIQAVSEVVRYAVELVRATRESAGFSMGAGTRGAIGLVRVAKAFAVMDGRDFVAPQDVKAAVAPVLRHRVALSPELLISGESPDEVLQTVVESVDAPRG